MEEQRISTGYNPRPLQYELHKNLKRFSVLVCHRRFGKTVFSLNHMLAHGLRNQKDHPQYAYIAPNYGQAKRVAWDMLKGFAKNFPGVRTHEQDLRLEIPRPDKDDFVRIMLLGAENPGSLKGLYLDGVILDEYAECDPIVWGEAVRPALSDRRGWAIFIGTPKGQNHFFDVHQLALKLSDKGWYQVIYKASETNILPADELQALKDEMSKEAYEQEMECSFAAALVGAYYGTYLEEAEEAGRIMDVPHDPALPVDTFWDLGMNDTTVIWFLQQIGTQYRLIDYIENSGEGLPWYARELKKDHRMKYNYRDDYMPHDAKVRDLGSGVSRQQTWRDLTGRFPRVLDKTNLSDGIEASRLLLPKCWFDRVKCERGLKALRNYQKKFDAKNRIWSSKPLHNWASNGADAFRTLAMGNRPEARRKNPSDIQAYADNDYNIFGG